jgi:hypothetical protein
MRANRAILFARKKRGRFARRAQVLRRRKACRLRMTELQMTFVQMIEISGGGINDE